MPSILESAIRSLGIDPAELQKNINAAVEAMVFLRNEFVAARTGFMVARDNLDRKLDALDERMERIEAILTERSQFARPTKAKRPKVNGADADGT